MKKKSLITMLAAVCLTGVVMVGATLAYLSDKTDVVTNTFTVGKVDIDLNETTKGENGEDVKWDDTVHGKNMYPGLTIDKKPVVTVMENSSDCVVYIKVTGVDAMEEQGFEINGFDSSTWNTILVPEGKKDGIYKYKDMVKKSATVTTLPAIFTSVTYKKTSEGITDTTIINKIDVKSAAVQAEGLTNEQINTEAQALLNAAE